ncbi:polyprotein, partial [Stocky prune virus]
QRYEYYTVNSSKIPVAPGCTYHSYMISGDCGVISFAPGGSTLEGSGVVPPKVCIMHDSNKMRQSVDLQLGHGAFLTQEDLIGYEVLLDCVATGSCLPEVEPIINGLSCDNVVCMGRLKKVSDAPHYSKKTQLERSLISDIVDLPCETVPAIISNEDPRIAVSCNPDFDVFVNGMEKYKKMAGPFEGVEGSDEQQDFHDALDDIFDCLNIESESLEEVSEEVALRGLPDVEYFDPIVASTSEGYPWILERPSGCKGKAWLLEGVPGCFSVDPSSKFGKAKRELELNLQQGVVPPLIGVECPKDERVARKKVTTKPKTRLFTVLPFEYNLLVREYFMDFVSKYMQRHNECPGKVGINPQSIEWTNLYENLRSKGTNWFNGDFERFDGITPRDVMVQLVIRINKLYKRGDADRPLANKVRSLLMLMASDRYAIAGRNLYKVSCGIPSGFSLTVIVNSLVNEFFLRFAWKRIVRASLGEAFVHRSIMDREVHFAVYGDDNLVSVSDKYSSLYNLVSISSFLRERGVVLKNGQCKDEEDFPPFSPSPSTCDFLKRRFVLGSSGRVLAPLDKSSLLGCAHWVRKSQDPGEAIVQNVQGILRECVAFEENSYEFFHDMRRKLLGALQTKGIATSEILDLKSCLAAQQCDESPFLKKFQPCSSLPSVIIPSSNLFVEVVGGRVFLSGVLTPSSRLPENCVVVYCGWTEVHKPYIQSKHSLICKSNKGYSSKAVIRKVLSGLPMDKPIVFMSGDGLSQAVPPMLIYLRRLQGVDSKLGDDILARCVKASSGVIPPEWDQLINKW